MPGRRVIRIAVSLGGVAALTLSARALIPGNPTTVGFAYLLLVLIIASTWGFVEAAFASVAATLAFNFFFFPPVGTFSIADPQNWVALVSFLATALIASRLSGEVKRRANDAFERQHDIERLYSFSRALLLIERSAHDPFAKQLVQKLAEIFEATAAVLYDRRSGEFFRAGPAEFDGLDEQIREAALQGASFADPEKLRIITAVRLGSTPIASLALQGQRMPDSVLQGIANLVAIGLERSRAQDLAHEVEAARRTEQLRTTLIDAMAHEFKTPLTSIKAATTSLLADPEQPAGTRTELLKIADEEAGHLGELIDDSIEMARLEGGRVDLQMELSGMGEVIQEAVASSQAGMDERIIRITGEEMAPIPVDRRLIRLALRQLLGNALKYSPAHTPLEICIRSADSELIVEITDHGKGIPPHEQERVFERFYRGAEVRQRIPGSGLGLSIARTIVEAHGGQLTLAGRPGETTFRMALPTRQEERN